MPYPVLLVTMILSFLTTCYSSILNSPVRDQHLLNSPLTLRNATASDAEAITNIILSAFDTSPHFQYICQFRKAHPRQHHLCLSTAISAALDLPNVLAQVVLLSNNTPPHGKVPVAAALWVLPSSPDAPFKPPLLSPLAMREAGNCTHADLNLTRAVDFDRQFTLAKYKYLDSLYASSASFYLDTLATHPDYQRRGAGGALVGSGVEAARKSYAGENVTATLIATEAGEPLYSHLGWESLRNFTVEGLDGVDGEREKWRFDVMRKAL